MDDKLREQVEQYILINHSDYPKPTLIKELIKSGFSRDDANEVYTMTLKKLLKPSEKMHYAKTSSLSSLLIGILFVILVLFFMFF
jgi:hypothetical protein